MMLLEEILERNPMRMSPKDLFQALDYCYNFGPEARYQELRKEIKIRGLRRSDVRGALKGNAA